MGSNDWTTLDTPTTANHIGAQLARQGPDIYALFPGNLAAGAGTQQADLYVSQNRGANWVDEADPCGSTAGEPDDAQAVAAAPDGVLAVLCAPRQGGKDFVIVSTDSGGAYGSHEVVSLAGPGQVAAATSASLVVANADSGAGVFVYRLLHSSDGGAHWKTVVDYDSHISQVVPDFLGFENAVDGRWIAPAGTLWTTADSGASWTRSQF